MDLNMVAMVGRLTRDVEMRTFDSGSAVANFSLAVNYRTKKNGEWVDEVSFIDCESWRADKIAQYLTKGKQIAVSGQIRQDRWQNDQGENRSKIKVAVSDIQLLGSKESNGDSNATYKPASASSNDGFTDEIPF